MGGRKDSRVSRRYHAFHKFDRDAVLIWDSRLTDALNLCERKCKHKLSIGEAYFYLFELGVDTIIAEVGELGEDSQRDIEVQQALDAIRLEKERKKQRAELYEEMGLDRFVEWCEARGEDWQSFLQEYNLFRREEARNWSAGAAVWLKHYLRDGEPHTTDDVKAAAIREGIIDDSSEETLVRDWAKLRQVAHREELTTGQPGLWQYVRTVFE